MALGCRLVGHPQAPGLISLLQSAERSLTLVSPFITSAGLAPVTQVLRKPTPPNLAILTSVTAESLWSGSCDPGALVELLETFPGATLRSLPGLHAKVYVADHRLALVTSANLTAPGLRANYEYGVLLRHPPTVRQIVDDLHAYSCVGTLLGTEELAALASLAGGLAARRRATKRSIAGLREEVAEIVLPAHVGSRSETGVFADAVYYALWSRGALPTDQIGEIVCMLHPELCDDSRERVINGRRFGKRWKHILRSAQQRLKKQGAIRRAGRVWEISGPRPREHDPL